MKRKIFIPIMALGALTLITVFGVATYRTVSAAASAASSGIAAVPVASFSNAAQNSLE